MPGFIRRFSFFPTQAVITAIEGIVIVDQTPSGVFVGQQTGTVCLVGEWPKGVQNAPTFAPGDRAIQQQFGGFSLSMRDPLSPNTNPYSNGCAFTWLKGKRFQNLVLVRTNMDLANGVKLQLEDRAASSVTGAKTIALVSGTTWQMTDPNAIFQAYDVGRTVTMGGFTNGGNNGAFPVTAVISPTVIQFTNAAGVAEVSPGTATWSINVTLQQNTTLPAGTRVRNPAGVTQEFGVSDDITWAKGTDLTVSANVPYVPPVVGQTNPPTYASRTVTPVPVYSTQGVAEGAVGNVTQVDATDLFRAGIGPGTSFPSLVVSVTTGALDGAGANGAALTPLTSNAIDTRYINAINAANPGQAETDNINIIASARQSAAIRTQLLAYAGTASSTSSGRVALTRPPIGTVPATAEGSVDPGVGANRGDRNIYCYPHFQQNIPEIAALDPAAAISQPQILLGADSAMSTILSLLPPERNPGQSTQSLQSGGLLNFIIKLEDGLTGANLPTKFQEPDYELFKSSGIAALRRDARISEWIFQSGVTSVDPTVFPTLAPIKRRRMADFLQDSMAAVALKFNKLPNTVDRFDQLVGEETDFLELMLSAQNPAQQRIAAYAIDSKSGNSLLLQGTGVRVLQIQVQLLDTLDYIVLQTTIGETVSVTAPPS